MPPRLTATVNEARGATGFKTRLAIIASTLLACAPALHAQAPVRGNGDIVVQELIIAPETETISLRAVCFSRAFSFTIVNHRFKPSVLSDARLDDRTKPTAHGTEALRQFSRAYATFILEAPNVFQKMKLG